MAGAYPLSRVGIAIAIRKVTGIPLEVVPAMSYVSLYPFHLSEAESGLQLERLEIQRRRNEEVPRVNIRIPGGVSSLVQDGHAAKPAPRPQTPKCLIQIIVVSGYETT